MPEDSTETGNVRRLPQSTPPTFAGFYVEIEYTEDIPAAASQYLAAIRTPDSDGLTLAFVRRTGRGLLRVDAFDGGPEPRTYPVADVQVVGHVVLTARVAAERRAAA